MRIKHRLSFNSSEEVARELAEIDIHVPSTGLVTVEVYEDEDKWVHLVSFVTRERPFDWVEPEYSQSEIESASLLLLQPDSHQGYPDPNPEEFGYRAVTYDPAVFCSQCGGGRSQIAPFVMKSEPKWGRRRIMQLNWVFDEFFVETHTYGECFAPAGIAFRPVLDRRGSTLETVVQLDIQEEVDLDVSSLVSEVCAKCGRIRYGINRRSPLAVLASPRAAIMRSSQLFGSGHDSHAEVFVTADLRASMEHLRIRGASFEPASVRDRRDDGTGSR